MKDTPPAVSLGQDDIVRLRNAVMRLSRELRRTSNHEGLSPTQSSVLATVVRGNDILLSDLAVGEGLNPTMLSRVVGHLENEGLVSRLKDEEDRRAARVRATPAGKRLIQRLRDRRSEELSSRLEHLDSESTNNLLKALPALEAMTGIEQHE